MISKFKSQMTRMVLMDSTIESLTPSVNAPSKKKKCNKKNLLGN